MTPGNRSVQHRVSAEIPRSESREAARPLLARGATVSLSPNIMATGIRMRATLPGYNARTRPGAIANAARTSGSACSSEACASTLGGRQSAASGRSKQAVIIRARSARAQVLGTVPPKESAGDGLFIDAVIPRMIDRHDNVAGSGQRDTEPADHPDGAAKPVREQNNWVTARILCKGLIRCRGSDLEIRRLQRSDRDISLHRFGGCRVPDCDP
jgi:hypothetical protein